MRHWAEPSGPAELDPPGSQGARPDRGGHSRGRGPDPGEVRRSPGRHEAQRGAGETGPTAGRPRLNPPRQHMADRAPRRGSLPMSGARLTAALECANDAGVRFTLRRPGDSHGASRLSAGAAASCASADRPASAVRAAPSEAVATPQSEGLVRARGEVWIHTSPPPAKGSLPANYPCAGRRFQRRFEAAEHLVIDGPSVRLLGIAVKDQDPDDRGPQPRLQGSGRACHVPRGRLPAKDRWTRSDPPGRSAWMSHAESPRCRARHRKRWSRGAPELAAVTVATCRLLLFRVRYDF